MSQLRSRTREGINSYECPVETTCYLVTLLPARGDAYPANNTNGNNPGPPQAHANAHNATHGWCRQYES